MPARFANPSCVRLSSKRRALTLDAICIDFSLGFSTLNNNILFIIKFTTHQQTTFYSLQMIQISEQKTRNLLQYFSKRAKVSWRFISKITFYRLSRNLVWVYSIFNWKDWISSKPLLASFFARHNILRQSSTLIVYLHFLQVFLSSTFVARK